MSKGGTTTRYAYNPDGQRTSKNVGSAFLDSQKNNLSSDMYRHAFWGGGRPLSGTTKELAAKKLSGSSILNSSISEKLGSIRGSKAHFNGSIELSANDNPDLFYSLQHIDYRVVGRKTHGHWILRVTVTDPYNFDTIRSTSGITFANLANDLGWCLQRIGMMEPYEFSVTFVIDLEEK